MNIVSKVINRLEFEKCKIEQYRVGKKFDVTLEEAYKRLELFSHNPKTSCYQRNKTTEQLLKDRQCFGLTPTAENFAYFLRMVKVTYKRTQRCNGVITKCIFIVQCNLYKHYEGIQIKENEHLQIALKNQDFTKYLKTVS